VLLVWNGPASAAEADPLRRRQVPLLAAVSRLGVSPVVALLGDRGGLGDALDQAGVETVRVAVPLPPGRGALPRLSGVSRTLRRLALEQRPQVIDASEPMPAIAAGLAAAGSGIPVLYRRHHQTGSVWLRVASRLAARLANRTVVSTDTMRQLAARQDRTPVERVEVARSGIPEPPVAAPEAIAAARERLGIRPETQVILAVGRLRYEKGFDLLIESLDALRDGPDVHVVILGDGPESSSLRALAARAPVPVHMPGHRSDIQTWLALSSLVAIPSRRESFGRVTLEAMAAGRPLVASAVGGLREAVDEGRTGLLVRSNAPEELGAALRRLVSDPALARAMGQAALVRYRERYTIDHMAASWTGVWRRLAEGRGPHA
jgi:glycosyltransferase involved in cell wall biosynthesis